MKLAEMGRILHEDAHKQSDTTQRKTKDYYMSCNVNGVLDKFSLQCYFLFLELDVFL